MLLVYFLQKLTFVVAFESVSIVLINMPFQ